MNPGEERRGPGEQRGYRERPDRRHAVRFQNPDRQPRQRDIDEQAAAEKSEWIHGADGICRLGH